MPSLWFLLFASFIGIYLNVWFLLMIFNNRNRLFETKTAKTFPKVSILIPAYNEAKSIGKTLRSVLKLDYPRKKLQVIVIDNGSTDTTPEIVKRFKGVQLLKLPYPSKAKALNEGLRHSDGELIGILDADTIVTKGSLKKMVGYFEDKKVGVVTNRIKVDSSKGFLASLQNIEYVFSAISKKIISLLNSMYVAPGTLSLIRRKILEKAGIPGDTLTEDMDIAFCVYKQGYKIINCLSVVTYTTIPKTLRKLSKQRLRWYRGFIENIVKHSDILFNKNYFHLGFFVIPFASFFALFIGISLTLILFFGYFRDTILSIKSIIHLPYVSDQIMLFLSNFNNSIVFLLSPYTLIMYSIILLSSFISLMYAFKCLKEKITFKILFFPFYFFVLYTLIMVFWFLAFIIEIFRWKRKW